MELHEYAQLRRDRAPRSVAGARGHRRRDRGGRSSRRSTRPTPSSTRLALPLFSPALDHAADGPLAGVPFVIKDSGPMARGRAVLHREPQPRRASRRCDSDLMTRFRAAGLVALGLTTVPELGHQLRDRVGQARADPQPVGPGAGRRRLQRRRRRARRGRRRADRPRQRRSRLDPDPGRLLRARRAQAEPRSHAMRAGHRRAAVRRRRRLRSDAHGPRRRPPPRCDPRAGRRRQVLRAAVARSLRRRARSSPARCAWR